MMFMAFNKFCYVLCYVDILLFCLQIDKLRKWKQDHVEQMASDLEDDAMSGGDVDRRLSDLRKEVVTSRSRHILCCDCYVLWYMLMYML